MQKLIYGGKLIVAMAGSWAIGASFFIFFSPVTARGVTSRAFRDSSIVVETFTKQQSWYEAQGLWGIFVLVIFAGLYLLGVRLAWRNRYVALAILSVILIALSIISGFSIGGIYMPAALGMFVGTLMFLSARLLRSR